MNPDAHRRVFPPAILGLLLFSILLPSIVFGQIPTNPVLDLPKNPDSRISRIAAFGSFLLVVADDGHRGEEPWVYSPDTDTIRLLRDLRPGGLGSRISDLIPVGDRLFFAATDEMHGHELWVTDGTSEGTKMTRDIRPFNSEGSNPRVFTAFRNGVLFLADDGVHEEELWYSDGTEKGTHLVKDIHPNGTGNGTTFEPVVMGDVALFRAVPVGEKGELWRTDGTEKGTFRIKIPDVYIPAHLTRIAGFDDFAIFGAIAIDSGVELWRTDGTVEGSQLIRDITSDENNSLPKEFGQLNGRLIFQARNETYGAELWVSDGTFEGTRILKDIIPGQGGSDPYPIKVARNHFFFSAVTDDYGRELWVSDGTTMGTYMLSDIVPGPKSGRPYAITVVGDGAFFSAIRSDLGEELWYSDGTTRGTRLVKDIFPGPGSSEPYSLQNLNGVLYFEANDGTHGAELWRSDGTEIGTRLVADLNRPGTKVLSSNPENLFPVGDSLYFTARIGDGNTWWHRTDGSWTGTARLDHLGVVRSAGAVTSVSLGMDEALVAFEHESIGTVVYHAKSDDVTKKGKKNLLRAVPAQKEMEPFLGEFAGYTDHEFPEMEATLDSVFVIGNDSLGRLEKEGAALREVKSDMPLHGIHNLKAFGKGIVFSASSEEYGEELWYAVQDQIELVKDVFPGKNSSLPREFTLLNDTLFFVADDGTSGPEVWKMDSADLRPVRITFLSSERNSNLGQPGGLVACNGLIYFAATDAAHGRELWVTDGTKKGTRMTSDIFRGTASSYPEDLTVVGNRIFFRAEAFEVGVELFASDGTSIDTYLVADKAVGHISFQPRELTAFDDKLFFVARGTDPGGSPDAVSLWYVDEGQLKILPASSNSPEDSPRNLTVAGNKLYFSAFDTYSGRELWVVKSNADQTGYSVRRIADLYAPEDEFTGGGAILITE